MLEYDEWAVPGEVEYAEKKAEEIETQIQKYHQDMEVIWMRRDYPIYIQITEHVIGKFKVILPGTVWNPPADPDINNDMMLEWFQDIVAPIDETKIFDLPAGRYQE